MLGPFIAATLAASASSVLAAPAAAPSAVQSYTSNSGAKWAYSNCQSDLAYGNRALPFSLDIASKTVESCLDACSKAGYALCGVEYYGECWGGDALDKTSTAQDESACNLPCRDNSLQLCGGTGGSTSATMNLYKRTNVPVAPAPVVPKVVQNYTSNSGAKWAYSNCQSDLAYGNRALPFSLDIASKTVESCLEACSKAGYALCGVEYYGECWGGNALDKTSTAQDESACNLACRDNSLQLCGGTGGSTSATMNLYKRTNVPVAPAPVVPKVVQNYTSSGGTKWGYSNCQSDLAYGNRALGVSLATANRTVQACLEACSKTEYKLCGIEYYGECWAGNELDKTSTAQAESACGLACADDASQLCGGVGGATNAAMNLYKRASVATSPVSSNNSTNTTTTPAGPTKYKADPNWAYKGCYTDSLLDDGRSLPNLLTAGNWSVQACLTAARSKGYSVAGVISGGQCWAGNAISPNAVKKNDTTCDYTCNDARSFTCGGDKVLDVYSSTVPPLETVPKNQTTFGKWKYDSCYSDSTSARSLPMQLDNPKGNIEGCLAACAAVNATLCGLEWYGECYASTTGLQNGAAKIDQSKCSTPCRSDSSQICGGSNALSIYKFNSCVPVQEPAQPGRYAKNFYNYKGCYTDQSGASTGTLLLPRLGTTYTQDECFRLVMAGGYAYGGLRVSAGCYGSNTFDVASAQLVDSSLCNLHPASSQDELWGGNSGGNGLTAVYELSRCPA